MEGPLWGCDSVGGQQQTAVQVDRRLFRCCGMYYQLRPGLEDYFLGHVYENCKT